MRTHCVAKELKLFGFVVMVRNHLAGSDQVAYVQHLMAEVVRINIRWDGNLSFGSGHTGSLHGMSGAVKRVPSSIRSSISRTGLYQQDGSQIGYIWTHTIARAG